MAVKSKGKIDIITFFYGFGAAVVLVGSMFKFVGWDYANELFITGLSVEALVFLVSAFERTQDDKEYEWEKVFPQLDHAEGGLQDPAAESYKQALGQFTASISSLSGQINSLNEAVLLMRQELEKNAKAGQQMHEKMEDFNKQLGEYNAFMHKINGKYREFLSESN